MPASNSDEQGNADAVKHQFREALQRKRTNATHRAAHEDGGSSKQQPHGSAGQKRQFRRKSG